MIPAALGLLLGGAVHAAPSPYYHTDAVTLELTLQGVSIPEYAADVLKKKGVKTVITESEDGLIELPVKPGALRKASAEGLLAMVLVALSATTGAEADLYIANKDDELLPISVHWQTNSTIEMRVGPPVPAEDPVRDPTSIVDQHQVLLVEQGRPWSPRAAGLLGVALDLLTEQERALLVGLPFHRTAEASNRSRAQLSLPPDGVLDALYFDNDAGRGVQIFDSALTSYSTQFVGDQDRPLPGAVLAILHEIGHVIAFTAIFEATVEFDGLYAELQQGVDAFNANVDRRNALVDRYNANPTDAVSRQIKALDALLADQQASLDVDTARVDALRTQAERKDTDLAAAFSLVLGGEKRAPTAYGRTSEEEAFAECFALFHADPAALLRASPEAHAWFAAGRHLSGT